MHIVYILSLLAATVCNFIAIAILLKRSEKTLGLISFIVLLLLINIWAIPQLIINVFELKGELFIAVDKISAIGYSFIPVPFFIFSLAFTNRVFLLKNYFIIFLIFILPFMWLYFAWNTSLIESRDFSKVIPSDWGYPVPTGPLFPYLITWFEGMIIFSLLLIIHLYRTTLDEIKKKQAVWLIIAVLIPLTFGTFTNGLLPAFHIHIFPSAIPLTSIMAIIIGYAIFRHELFELTPLTILTSIGSGVITVDKEGKIIHANHAAHDVLGLRRNNLTNKIFYNVITLQKKKNQILTLVDKNPLMTVLLTGEHIESSDLLMYLPKKRKIPVECTITPIIQKKEIKGATLVFKDITKEKELESRQNQFIGIASHELKTPLTSIKAFGQLLEVRLKQVGDQKDRYFIATINQQVDKIMLLINDLLDINKIDEGKYSLNKTRHNVNALVKKIVNNLQYTSATHKIHIEGKLTDDLMIDEERIEQVLINLITNAIKYSPNADKVIVRLAEDKREATISVQDFGIGIPKEDLKKIFGRFYRTKMSRESNIAGFGLGLAICAENIHRHNGKIWVKSKVAKNHHAHKQGSTFFFSLPRIKGK